MNAFSAFHYIVHIVFINSLQLAKFSKIMRKIVLNIFRNYTLLKLFFASFTLYLLYEEFLTFFVKKPTYTSSSKVKIVPQDFPSITICPFPSWDLEGLNKFHYANWFDYAKGTTSNSTIFGWSGIRSEINPETVLNQISIIKNQTECPFTLVKLRLEKKEKFIKVKFRLTSLYYSSGRCCKVSKTSTTV